jgi:hypothetical protein
MSTGASSVRLKSKLVPGREAWIDVRHAKQVQSVPLRLSPRHRINSQQCRIVPVKGMVWIKNCYYYVGTG